MKINAVYSVYYSAVGATEKVVTAMADAAANALGAQRKAIDYTLPAARQQTYAFTETDLVFFATPVYAGRIPNKLLPFVQSGFTGNGALAVPVVTFGNRSFDEGLGELKLELEAHGFHTIAGAGIPCRHVFSPEKLAAGRPNDDDLAAIAAFGKKAAEKATALAQPCEPIAVPGHDPVGPYYVPKGTDGKPAVFLKAKPLTDTEKCVNCGICAASCPVGSINPEDVTQVNGICIKCQACVRKCPTGAKYFDDPAFLSHVAMLEANFTGRQEAQWFI